MVEFDLFKLHVPEEDFTPRRCICAIGKNLYAKLDEIINEIIKNKGYIVTYVKVEKDVIQKIYKKCIIRAGSQQDLAEILGVARQDFYRWKECKRRIPLEKLKRLIEYSGTNVDVRRITLETRKYLIGINRQKIAKILAKRSNSTLNFTEKIIYKMRQEVVLIFIIELLKFWKELLNKSESEVLMMKKEIQATFEYLKQNNRAYKVIAVKELTPILSKIVGAMLADGCIVRDSNSMNILDEDKLNLDAFSNWINETFGLLPKIRKHKTQNAWCTKIDNKVIRRYFTVFFEFSNGKKHQNYDIPTCIRNAKFEIQKACVHGVMSFDGVVRITKEVGINIGSKRLRDSLYKVFKKHGLKVTKSKKPDRTGMWRLYSSGNFDRNEYQKWLEYFVKGSDRWFRIYEWVNGYQGSVKNIKEASVILEKCFPVRSNSKITLTQIFNVFVENKILSLAHIIAELKDKNIEIAESTLWIYTGILREMNIIRKKRLSDNTNVYILNEEASEWRLPNRLIS